MSENGSASVAETTYESERWEMPPLETVYWCADNVARPRRGR